MAVRTTMAELISRLRLLINDVAGASQTFTDQELQDALDARRTQVRYLRLEPIETITPGGTVEYYDFYSSLGDWEADETLVDSAYNALTPSVSNRLLGQWTFAEDVETAPVLLNGKTYDLYGAAADVLEAWAAKEKLSFDFSADGLNASRSQKARALLDLAREYRQRERPAVVVQVRSDVNIY